MNSTEHQRSERREPVETAIGGYGDPSVIYIVPLRAQPDHRREPSK